MGLRKSWSGLRVFEPLPPAALLRHETLGPKALRRIIRGDIVDGELVHLMPSRGSNLSGKI